MMKYILSIFSIMLILAIEVQSAEKLNNGFGATVSVSTTPQSLFIEQMPNSDIASNGTFATSDYWQKQQLWTVSGNATFTTTNQITNGTFAITAGWVTNNAMFHVTGGKGKFITTEANTATLYQVFGCVSGRSYTVQYTIESIADGSSFQPSIGYSYGTAKGTNGTYMESILCTNNSTNVMFTGISGAESTQYIDNVIVRQTGLYETNNIYETIVQLTSLKSYRLTYTVANMDTTTNWVTAYLGTNAFSEVTTNGTYIEDLTFSLNADSNLYFRGVATNISAFTIDDVKISEAPKKAYADTIVMSVDPLDAGSVYVAYDCSAVDFTNMVAQGRTIMVNSNNSPVTISIGDQNRNIQKIWYRSSSGALTFTINGY